MNNIEFIPHTGTDRPVPERSYVVYRTTMKPNHIHLPIEAHEIDWSHDPITGRIKDYAVVNKPESLRRNPVIKNRPNDTGLTKKRKKKSK